MDVEIQQLLPIFGHLKIPNLIFKLQDSLTVSIPAIVLGATMIVAVDEVTETLQAGVDAS